MAKVQVPTQEEFNQNYSELMKSYSSICSKCSNYKKGCYSKYCRKGYRYPFQCGIEVND